VLPLLYPVCFLLTSFTQNVSAALYFSYLLTSCPVSPH
jgi:hypothetical protein